MDEILLRNLHGRLKVIDKYVKNHLRIANVPIMSPASFICRRKRALVITQQQEVIRDSV